MTGEEALEGAADAHRVEDVLQERLGGATELPAGEQRWQLIIEAANDAYVAMDEDGMIVGWNSRATEILGWSPDEVLGQPLAEVIIPDRYRDAHWEGLERFLETGRGRVLFNRLELPALRRDGREFDAEVTIWPHRQSSEKGGEWHFNAFLRDITDRKRAQTFIRLLERVARSANEARDLRSAVNTALAEICEATDWPVGHAYVVDRDDPELLLPTGWWHVPEGDFETFRRVTETKSFPIGEGLPGRVLESGEPAWIPDIDADDNFTRRDSAAQLEVRAGLGIPVLSGNVVVAVLEFYSPALRSPDDELLAILGDVGAQLGRVYERVEDARERRLANARLEEANRQKDEVVSVVAHELRNPLGAITGFCDAMLEDDLDEEDRRIYIERIHRHGQRMLQLVRDLLTVSRLDVGSIEATREDVRIAEVVEQVIGDFKLDEVSLEGDDDVKAHVDRGHLVQILANLLANAEMHGEPPVEVQWAAGWDRITISVCDHGDGVPASFAPQLFDRFAVRQRSRGTGLGLAISSELAELNGGLLRYTQNEPSGACFHVELVPAHG